MKLINMKWINAGVITAFAALLCVSCENDVDGYAVQSQLGGWNKGGGNSAMRISGRSFGPRVSKFSNNGSGLLSGLASGGGSGFFNEITSSGLSSGGSGLFGGRSGATGGGIFGGMLGGMLGGDASGTLGNVDLGQSLNQLAGARIAIISAQLKMLEALGLKTEAAVRLSESKRILEGASSDSGAQVKALNDSVKASKAAGEEIRDAMKESGQLSAEKKRAWLEARLMWVKGIILEKQQVETISALAKQLRSNPLLAIPILQLSRLTLGDLKEFNNFRKVAKEFRKKQEIVLPEEDNADEMLGEL